MQVLVLAYVDACGWLAIAMLGGLLLVLLQAPTSVPELPSRAAARLLALERK